MARFRGRTLCFERHDLACTPGGSEGEMQGAVSRDWTGMDV
jgi:hypothetical protein